MHLRLKTDLSDNVSRNKGQVESKLVKFKIELVENSNFVMTDVVIEYIAT